MYRKRKLSTAVQSFSIQSFRKEMTSILLGVEGQSIFFKALDFAEELHKPHRRNSGAPYIMHPCSVALILAKELGLLDVEVLAAALLHDVIEMGDGVTFYTLLHHFGQRIAQIVDGCTKLAKLPDISRQREREETYNKLFSSGAEQIEVLLVKLADRLHNMRTIDALPMTKKQRIGRETLEVYAPIAAKLNIYPLKRELGELALKCLYPKKSRKIISKLRELSTSSDADEIKEQLEEGFKNLPCVVDVYVRVKGLSAYYDENRRRLLDEPIQNEIDIIVVLDTDNESECYNAMGISNGIFTPVPRTLRDFIANPKSSGYKSLHVRINHGEYNYLIKFRTRKMHLIARYGFIAYLSETKSNENEAHWKELMESLKLIGHYDQGSAGRKEMIKESNEIFTWTPENEIVYLPQGSNVLDFAYQIHTELGNHCIGATIREKVIDVDQSLKDGDIVHVNTIEQPLDILDPVLEGKCHTPRARSAINRRINRQREEFAKIVGKQLVDYELSKIGLSERGKNEKEIQQILEILNIDLPQLYRDVGFGLKNPTILSYYLNDGLENEQSAQDRDRILYSIEINRLNLCIFKFSRCCKPYPGEVPLVAGLSERGISIHLPSCPELARYKLKKEEMLEIRWSESVCEKRLAGELVLNKLDDPLNVFKGVKDWAAQNNYWDFTSSFKISPNNTKLRITLNQPTVKQLAFLLVRFPRKSFFWHLKWGPKQPFKFFSRHKDPSEEFILHQI